MKKLLLAAALAATILAGFSACESYTVGASARYRGATITGTTDGRHASTQLDLGDLDILGGFRK